MNIDCELPELLTEEMFPHRINDEWIDKIRSSVINCHRAGLNLYHYNLEFQEEPTKEIAERIIHVIISLMMPHKRKFNKKEEKEFVETEKKKLRDLAKIFGFEFLYSVCFFSLAEACQQFNYYKDTISLTMVFFKVTSGHSWKHKTTKK